MITVPFTQIHHITFQAVVVRKASEMPEGVELSDGGDASDDGLAADDPHRALGDITLDDIEYTAPYKSKSDGGSSRYENNSYATTANGGLDGVPDSLFGGGSGRAAKPKKAKKAKEVVAKDGDSGKKRKKSKKEKKEKEKKKEKDKSSDLHEGEIPGTDDVDFWLSNDVTAAK